MSDDSCSETYADWVLPDFGDTANQVGRTTQHQALPTAEDLDDIYQNAQKEGYNRGYAEGQAAAEEEINQKIAALNNIITVLDNPFYQISDEVINTIKQLSLVIARQVVRREISLDENNIIATIKKSLSLISDIDKQIQIHINPDDKEIISTYLSTTTTNIRLVDDETISRGGCRIENTATLIDATVESQLNEIASSILGGLRNDDE